MEKRTEKIYFFIKFANQSRGFIVVVIKIQPKWLYTVNFREVPVKSS